MLQCHCNALPGDNVIIKLLGNLFYYISLVLSHSKGHLFSQCVINVFNVHVTMLL